MGFWSALSAITPGQAAAINAGASLIGSVGSGLLSQRSANRQMAFQAQQTGSGYQRAVADMKKAGLNPMLAAKLGPASSGSGAMASFPDFGQAITRGAQAGLATASQAKTLAETVNVPKQGDLIEAQTKVARATVEEKKQAINLMKAQVSEIMNRLPKLIAETRNIKQQTQLLELQQETEKFKALLAKANANHQAVVAFYYQMLKEDGVLYEAMLPKLNYLLVKGGQIIESGKKANPSYVIDEMTVSP